MNNTYTVIYEGGRNDGITREVRLTKSIEDTVFENIAIGERINRAFGTDCKATVHFEKYVFDRYTPLGVVFKLVE